MDRSARHLPPPAGLLSDRQGLVRLGGARRRSRDRKWRQTSAWRRRGSCRRRAGCDARCSAACLRWSRPPVSGVTYRPTPLHSSPTASLSLPQRPTVCYLLLPEICIAKFLQFPKLFNGRKEFIQQNFILRFLLFSSSFFLFFSDSLPFFLISSLSFLSRFSFFLVSRFLPFCSPFSSSSVVSWLPVLPFVIFLFFPRKDQVGIACCRFAVANRRCLKVLVFIHFRDQIYPV